MKKLTSLILVLTLILSLSLPLGAESLTSSDALTILRAVAGTITLDAEQQSKYDLDKDGKITTADAVAVLRSVVDANSPPRTFSVKTIEIKTDYFIVDSFSEGLARAEKDGKCGFIDDTGNIIIPLKYDADRGSQFSDGLALVYEGGGYLNASQRIMSGGKCGFIDKTGKVVIPLKYDAATNFSEGLAAVKEGDNYYIIDKKGKVVANIDNYYVDLTSYKKLEVGPFSEGLALVGKNGKYGFINTTGEKVISFIYDWARPFSNGYASVRKDGKYGVINKAGDVIIQFEYEDIGIYSDGLMSFNKDGSIGYMDIKGRVIIALDYEVLTLSFAGGQLSPFRDGLAVVHGGNTMDGSLMSPYSSAKWGVIDKTGKEVVPRNYSYITKINNGLAVGFIGSADFYHNHFSGTWRILQISAD